MKKTYISPATKVTKVQLTNMLLTLSTSDSKATLTGGKVDMEARDNAWDIWGTDDDFED